MNMDDFISKDSIKVNVKALSKKRLLQDISNLAQECLGVSCSELYSSLQKREILGPTGIGNGVAIPHVKIKGLNKLSGFFLILEMLPVHQFATHQLVENGRKCNASIYCRSQIFIGFNFGQIWWPVVFQ